jgi:drug/metabolite transporter (DMT)-like permease
VIAGAVVFGHLPNPMALAGILLIVASGLAVVLLDARPGRPAPVA